VPNVLVYVDPERLAALRGARDGEPWVLRRGELLDDGLMRPPDWTLYVTTVRDGEVHVVGYLECAAVDSDVLGTITTCDVDVSPIVERLGCAAGAAGWARWAMWPVVVTKNDADLLRWRLGLPLDVVAPPPTPAPPPKPRELPTGFEHDARALELLGAVYEDLMSDADRMVLADRLLEIGDPRGEMIALQLARARTGAAPTARERELIVQHGHTWTMPATGCLRSFEFRRGFLAVAELADASIPAPVLAEHRVWSTVEELETRSMELLVAPSLRSLRRVAVSSELLDVIVRHERELPFATIVGCRAPVAGPRTVQPGVTIRDSTIADLIATPALARVRAMSFSIETPQQAELALRALASPFGAQLEHVELYRTRAHTFDIDPWWETYGRNRPMSFGLRTFLGEWMLVIVRQHNGVFVQLGGAQHPFGRPPDISGLLRVVRGFGRGRESATVEQIGEHAVDLEPVVATLRQMFRTVTIGDRTRWRSP
jgi:hypothetical protein